MVIVYIGTGYIHVLYLGRAPRTKKTLPDFHEWRRVTRHPLVFHGLTGSQWTPRLGDPTVEILRAKKKTCSTHRGLRVGSGFEEF